MGRFAAHLAASARSPATRSGFREGHLSPLEVPGQVARQITALITQLNT
jgi:hypothetical protein